MTDKTANLQAAVCGSFAQGNLPCRSVSSSVRDAADRWRWLGWAMCVVLASRFASEIINTFVWNRANYVWSAAALMVFATVLWPVVLVSSRGERNILAGYFPVLAYLGWLLARIRPQDPYSIKSVFSEVIVWSCFIFTAEICSRSGEAASALRKWLMWLVKITVLVGVCQLVWFVAVSGSLDPRVVIEARPVYGVFVHPNLFLVVVLPFIFVFIKNRSYAWLCLAIAACLGTGTRSPLFAAACLLILIWRSAFRLPIAWRHVAVSMLIVVVAYSVLIGLNMGARDFGAVVSASDAQYSEADSRFNLSTLQWRIAFWQNFLEDRDPLACWFGHGSGTADAVSGVRTANDDEPHNDYLRVYYDLGLVGLFTVLAMWLLIVRLLMRSTTPETDFVVLGCLLVVCFRFTDNFMYRTIPLWIYMFMATFVRWPADASRNEGRAVPGGLGSPHVRSEGLQVNGDSGGGA